MSFELKIRKNCDHVLREELHSPEQDQKTVLLNYGMAATAKLQVKVNGTTWPRDNKDEIFKNFDISNLFTNSKNLFVVPSVPFYKGNNLGEFANSPSEAVLAISQTEELEEQADGYNMIFRLSYGNIVSPFNCFSDASPGGIEVLVNCDEVELEDVDSKTGIIVFKKPPQLLDRITVTYWRRVKIKTFNGENGRVEAAEEIQAGSTVSFCAVKQEDNGWSLEDNLGSISDQRDIIFDKLKDTNKSQVIGEDLSDQINGRTRLFRTHFSSWLRFESTITTTADQILFNSFTILLNDKKVLPVSYDPEDGIFLLREAPKLTDSLTINYFYDDGTVPNVVEVTYLARRTACPKCFNLQELWDYKFDTQGRLEAIENEEKLIQDLLKATLTIRTTNATHQWYGTLVEQLIGDKNIPQVTPGLIGSEITNAVRALQNLQGQQSDYQIVSAQEMIDRIENVQIEFNAETPEFISLRANIVTFGRTQRDLTTVLTKYGAVLLDVEGQKFPTLQNLTKSRTEKVREAPDELNQGQVRLSTTDGET